MSDEKILGKMLFNQSQMMLQKVYAKAFRAYLDARGVANQAIVDAHEELKAGNMTSQMYALAVRHIDARLNPIRQIMDETQQLAYDNSLNFHTNIRGSM